jgi:hypothetical protein
LREADASARESAVMENATESRGETEIVEAVP